MDRMRCNFESCFTSGRQQQDPQSVDVCSCIMIEMLGDSLCDCNHDYRFNASCATSQEQPQRSATITMSYIVHDMLIELLLLRIEAMQITSEFRRVRKSHFILAGKPEGNLLPSVLTGCRPHHR